MATLLRAKKLIRELDTNTYATKRLSEGLGVTVITAE